MRNDLAKKRTFILCGHAQSGKTSLAEAILFKCKAINRLGKIDEGTTTSDYEDDEKNRKSSINLSVLNCEHKGNFLQFIDTPGHLDFVGEVVSAARAVDFAVIVVDAVNGIDIGTEKAWEIIRRENLPCLFFVNKLDKEGVSFDKCLEDIKIGLTKNIFPLAVFNKGKASNVLNDKNNIYYDRVVEKVAETNDALLEKYLANGALENNEIIPALEKAIINSQVFPVIGGIAILELGVDILLDLIVDIMPNCHDALWRNVKKDGKEISLEAKIDSPLTAQVFKTVIDPFVGQLNIFRVFSGKITANSEVYNVTKSTKEKLGQVYILQGKQEIPQDVIYAGEIGAVAKLKDVATLDIFCESSQNIEFPALEFPNPAYSASVKPKTRQDEDRISTALSRLTSEDSTFKVSIDPQTKELIISGMSELHLHVIIERIKKRYGVDVELGIPKVPYRETVTKVVKVQGKYKKQTGGHGQYGDCWIEVEPLERGKNFEFVDKIVGGSIPRNYIPSVEKGIRKAMEEGILAGFNLTDIRVVLFDGSYHPVDSSDIAFQIAATMALKKALEEAGSVLLEPVMNVEIIVPDEFMGQITGDINSKRGRVLGVESKGKNEAVKAQMPQAEMFKYASDLRSLTGGRGSFTMQFSHYDIVPSRIAQTVIEHAKAARPAH